MVRRSIRVLAFLLSVSLLALTLALAWEFPTVAQIPLGLGWSEAQITSEPHVPVFTRWNLDLAPVFLDGKIIGTVSSFTELASDKDDSRASSYGAATRSQLIHTKLQKILGNMLYYSEEVLPKRGISRLEAQEKELRKQLVTNVSEKKGTAFVSVTFPQDTVPQIIFSVTQADTEIPRMSGSQALKIAEKVANVVDKALIQAWKERQTPHLLAQGQRVLLVLVVLTGTSLSLWWMLHKPLDSKKRRLTHSLSRTETIEAQSNLTSHPSPVTVESGAVASQLEQKLVERKLSLNQRYSLNDFYRTGLFWTQWLVWLLGIGYLASLFYWTRPLSNWIVGVTVRGIRSEALVVGWPPADWLFSFGQEATLGTPLFVLLLLLATRLTLKGGDALSDFLVRQWSEEQLSQRGSLRATTLTRVFKGWLRAIVYLLLGMTLVYHLQQLGAITHMVAILVGVLSFALSLASQDLLRDLISGLLILWEDQYTVGDWIVIGEQYGWVEKITLRVTQLRNLDGELITIPNGSIGRVRNYSSEWSQVNYAIEIGYNADVDRVLEVMEAVCQQLYRDPQWQELILEAPKVLGVDRIAHTGILIRVIIKTQPLQQWSVAREFRRRLKKTFDEQDIEVGIPQRKMMYVNGPFPTTSNGDFEIDSQHQS